MEKRESVTGVWLSWLERSLHTAEVTGSSPVTPTSVQNAIGGSMHRFSTLDEFPIHQIALPMAYTGTSDRNSYDRCIYQGIDREGEINFITGLGVYPNLGTIDAYFCVRIGDRQLVVRTSGARPEDQMAQEVGPYRIEVIEPLHKVRVVLDADEQGISADLTFTATVPVIPEPQHSRRLGDVVLLDAARFCSIGVWEGEIVVEGKSYQISPERFAATRDRSWGIRPVGEAVPAGRPQDFTGMWWYWMPMQFDDFAVHIILEEDQFGVRSTNYAVRVWPENTGKPIEQLGWPIPKTEYLSGTRTPLRTEMELVGRDGTLHSLTATPMTGIALNVGCGYGGDPDWSHGIWKGEAWVEGASYNYQDEAVSSRITYSIVDHFSECTFDGQRGYGIFEHGVIGPHAPTGFDDFFSLAP